MGRRPKTKRQRTVAISFRVTEEEARLIDERRARLGVSRAAFFVMMIRQPTKVLSLLDIKQDGQYA